MVFGTIMVNVDFDEDSQDRIHIAAGIANRFGSFLIGVAGVGMGFRTRCCSPGARRIAKDGLASQSDLCRR